MDASNYTIRDILSQEQKGRDLPIAYTSYMLRKSEKKYGTIKTGTVGDGIENKSFSPLNI